MKLDEIQAYLGGELTDAAADALEDAMFDAPDDGEVALFDQVARHGAVLAAHGTFDVGVTKAHVDKLLADGYTVQILDAGTPSTQTFHMDGKSDFVLTRMDLGRTDLARVDVEITVPAYNVTKTIREVLVDSDGCVYGLCERALAEIGIGANSLTRVRESDGARAVIAEWTLNSVRV